jgi:hypothetical protein
VTIDQYIGHCELYQPIIDYAGGEGMTDKKLLVEKEEEIRKLVDYWLGVQGVNEKLTAEGYVSAFFKIVEADAKLKDVKPIRKFQFKNVQYSAPKDMQEGIKRYTSGQATFGQVVAAMSWEQDSKGLLNREFDKIPYVLAHWFLANGETYEDVDIDRRAQEFMQLPAEKAQGAYFFLSSTNFLLGKPTKGYGSRGREKKSPCPA